MAAQVTAVARLLRGPALALQAAVRKEGAPFFLVRVLLGTVFFVAGAVKIWDFSEGGSATTLFYRDIENYQILESPKLIIFSALYLPWLELVLGGALLSKRATPGAAAICAGLMLIFIAALASAWSRGLDISCGCFGHENATANFPLLLVRDCVLLLGALVVTWRERKR